MKKLICGLLAIASLFLLSACDAGVAAQIGDTKISQNTVQSRVAEILSERRNYQTADMQLSFGEELNRSELRFLVIGTIFQKLAEENGIKVTKAMVDTRKAEILNQLGGTEQLSQALVNAQLAPSDFDFYLKSILISERLSEIVKSSGVAEDAVGTVIQNSVRQLTQKIGIKINPQYGTWNSEAADLTAFDAAGTAVKPLMP